MPSREARTLAISIGIIISLHVACNSATAPSPVPPGYAGDWTGTTTQGTPVQFRVSAADNVTYVNLSYTFSAACSGTLTITDLAVPIHMLDPPGPPPYDQPGFAFGTEDETGAISVAGYFSPDRRSASGGFILVRYGACGSVLGTWSASRR